MRSFYWISNLVGEALKSSFCFLFSKQNVTIRRKRRRWARKFLASGPWIHPTNGTRRYGAKEAYPRLGSLAARQTFFQAVDRLPHPSYEVACILSSLSSLILLDQTRKGLVLFSDWYTIFGWALWINLSCQRPAQNALASLKSVLASLRSSNSLWLRSISDLGHGFIQHKHRVLHVINYNRSWFRAHWKHCFLRV